MLRTAGPDQRAARQPGILVIGREVGLTERLVGLHHAVVLLVPARLVAGGRCGGGGRRKDSTGKSGAGCQADRKEHTSELQSLMRISYAVLCLKKKKENTHRELS